VTATGTAEPRVAAPALPARPGLLSKVKPPHLFSGLITVLLVIGQWRFRILPEQPLFGVSLGFLDAYTVLATSLAVAIGCELVLSRLVRGVAWPSVLSAYISGNSIVILTKPQAGILWPFVLGAAIAITSKYVLTWRGRHLWNPTNFSVSAVLLLAPGSVTILSHEWGNELATVAIIWAIGLAVVARAKLLHITLTYLACFLLLGAVRAALNDTSWLVEIGPVTGPMYQLLMFFMLTDPRTTVSTRRGRIAVVVLVAMLECVLRLGNDHHAAWAAPFAAAPAIFSLALIGPIAMWIDLER
jgi:enediyne biosynthesis protein E5